MGYGVIKQIKNEHTCTSVRRFAASAAINDIRYSIVYTWPKHARREYFTTRLHTQAGVSCETISIWAVSNTTLAVDIHHVISYLVNRLRGSPGNPSTKDLCHSLNCLLRWSRIGPVTYMRSTACNIGPVMRISLLRNKELLFRHKNKTNRYHCSVAFT